MVALLVDLPPLSEVVGSNPEGSQRAVVDRWSIVSGHLASKQSPRLCKS